MSQSQETVPGRKSLAQKASATRPVQLEFPFMREMPPQLSLPQNGEKPFNGHKASGDVFK